MNVWIVSLLSAIGLVNGACPDGWTHHGVSCYRLRYDTETWIDAKLVCEMDGGHLAEIGDVAENNFIHGLITDSKNVWLGGTDLGTETEWKWVTSKEAISYTNWKPNEPNNSGHDENCLEMQYTGVWNDRPCHYVQKYVCERPFGYVGSFITSYMKRVYNKLNIGPDIVITDDIKYITPDFKQFMQCISFQETRS